MQNHLKIKEELLHYIWENKLFYKNDLTDEDGNDIIIEDVGLKNNDAGPDFFNSKIKIGNTTWAGNIEIHINSSDWNKHNHNVDKAYDNVILHLVFENDKDVFNTKGEKILTCELKFDEKYLKKYEYLINSEDVISCKSYINKTESFILNSWLSSLLIERIEQKTTYIKQILEFTSNNWEEAFYISLAKAFGFKVNSLPFEILAKSLPSIILAKNKNNVFQLESLLFGQAGMLNNKLIEDAYFTSLQKEYAFLKNKYKLKPIEPHLWKFLRIRPVNFPTIRISQFAQLINKSSHLFSKIVEAKNIKTLQQMFNIQASEYWNAHYTFGKISKKRTKKVGKSAIENILINTVIPILFLYGKEKGKTEIQEKAFYLLEQIKPEKNKIINKWEDVGLEVKNAYFSQSLIQLYNEYCLKKRCLNCRIGNKYLKY